MGYFLLAAMCHADERRYQLLYVYDGDTVKLRPFGAAGAQSAFKLRLTDIDAPERRQDYGMRSRQALIELCWGKNMIITADIVRHDQYQRSLGRLKCNGDDASYYLAEHGLAWYYKAYAHDVAIEKAANNARRLTLGLWADDNPTPPWVWRHQHQY